MPARMAFSKGTTSACAENTPGRWCPPGRWWNYLRMRGEYESVGAGASDDRELPPHARRIPHATVCRVGYGGTTSACAENTPHGGFHQGIPGNYLRMRGEYNN